MLFINSDPNATVKSYFSNVRLHKTGTGAESLLQTAPNYFHVSNTAYDAFGRPVQVANADGTTTSTIYDAAGRQRFAFDELGHKTELAYDRFGRLERTIAPDPDGPFGTAQSPYTRYEYDAAGTVINQWDFFGKNDTTNVEYADRILYDARNRLVTTIRKDNTRLANGYDVAGQLVAATDPLGNSTYTIYDDRGRVVEQRLADSDGSGSQVAPVTTHEYDAVGNLISTTDPLFNRTWFEYDSLNRLRKESKYESPLIVDNIDGNDSSFSTAGSSIPPSYEINYLPNAVHYYGGDVTYWTDGTTRTATWSFAAVDAGHYRVAMTWWAYPYYDSNATVEILVGSSVVRTLTIDQQKAGTIPGLHDGRLLNWTLLDDDLNLVAGNTAVSVRLTGTGGNLLMADAVRLDRVASTQHVYDKNGNVIADIDTPGMSPTTTTTSSIDFTKRFRQIRTARTNISRR